MTKEEARFSVMGAISMALKDPTLQQGFEIICKNLSELEETNAKLQAKIDDWQSEYIELENFKNNEIAELKEQIEKMKDCLNKWYKKHNDDDYTETFYDNLLRDTEKCLWGDSVND